MKKLVQLILLCGSFLVSLNSSADIYFNQKIAGPITNISRLTEDNTTLAVTQGKRQQDREFSVAPNGDVAFSSNRINITIPEKSKTDAPRTRQLNIFIQSGEKLEQISENSVRSFSPKYNHSGTQLAYLNTIEKNVMNLTLYDVVKKTSVNLITTKNVFDFDWSTDNRNIVYSESDLNTSSIKLVDTQTKKNKTLVSANLNSSQRQNTTETQKSQDTKHNLSYLIGAKWSPDNKHVAYIKHPTDREKKKTLYVINLKTLNTQKISDDNLQVQTPIDWNSKSNTLLYSALVDYKFYYDEKKMDKVYEGALHIYTTTLGGKTSQLTSGSHFHGKPVFSPDDSRIAYLYAEKLGDQRTYTLKTINNSGEESEKNGVKVSRESNLQWISLDKSTSK